MYKSVLESGAAPLSSLAGPPRKIRALCAARWAHAHRRRLDQTMQLCVATSFGVCEQSVLAA